MILRHSEHENQCSTVPIKKHYDKRLLKLARILLIVIMKAIIY